MGRILQNGKLALSIRKLYVIQKRNNKELNVTILVDSQK
jgi:hypothetical protein